MFAIFSPVAVAAAYVIGTWGQSGTWLDALIRPLALVVVFGGAACILASWLFGRRIGSLVVLVLVLLALGIGFLLIAVALVLGVQYLRVRTGRELMQPAISAIRPFALALLLAATAMAGPWSAVWMGKAGSEGSQATAHRLPDIYVVLLDGYPRADTLASFGHDNGPFLAELEARGFDVSDGSTSNYMLTSLTLASMLHMRHISDIDQLKSRDGAPDRLGLSRAIRTAPVIEELRAIGYTIAAIESPSSGLGLAQADIYLENARFDGLEIRFFDRTEIGLTIQRLVPGLLESALRDHIAESFHSIGALAEDPRPTFMLAHIWSPHAPSIFLADGSPAPVGKCRPDCGFLQIHPEALGVTVAEFVDMQWQQIQHINNLTLDAIDLVLAKPGPPPIIVVMSDHGMRTDDNNRSEWLRNLFAAFTPGHANLFGSEPTPVNLFPRVLQSYFGRSYPLQRDLHYLTPDLQQPLDFKLYEPAS